MPWLCSFLIKDYILYIKPNSNLITNKRSSLKTRKADYYIYAYFAQKEDPIK